MLRYEGHRNASSLERLVMVEETQSSRTLPLEIGERVLWNREVTRLEN